MDVFVVRPFGTKAVLKKAANGTLEQISFDFDRVQTELIDPALKDLQLDGGTTGRIFTSGEIRTDMFSELLLADLVIADISVHNANVFYELGIRNALRDRTTILVKCPGFDDTPFDIIGYRYVSYDQENPSKSLGALKQAIVESREGKNVDSPVFNMLPRLEVPDFERFSLVPPDFMDELRSAKAAWDKGKVALLAAEAMWLRVDIAVLKQVGEVLYAMKAYEPARAVWERVLEEKPEDVQAAERLATIYQRKAEKELRQNAPEFEKLLARSDWAIEQILNNGESLTVGELAEAWALRGRNAKARWARTWMDAAPEKKIRMALQSDFWDQSLSQFERGYYSNLNHYYSGINALALLTIILGLAQQAPDTWSNRFLEEGEAELKLMQLKTKQKRLAEAVKFTLDAERSRLDPGAQDIWLDITTADFLCISSAAPEKVSAAYQRILDRCDQLQRNTMIKQLLLYRALGAVSDNVAAALAVTGELPNEEDDDYYILFTGHMVDAPDRAQPRFPAGKEAAVRAAIRAQLQEITSKLTGKDVKGVAGAACGGDILFHECCQELGIKSTLYLALPRAQFLQTSVRFAGEEWVERFDTLYSKLPRKELAESNQLPNWLKNVKEYSFWERNNNWMLQNALANGGENLTLIALWDGKSGDGPGGTRHLVTEARKQGGKTEVIDINLI
jgi:tetratricopeptide (TPR) repeat protein